MLSRVKIALITGKTSYTKFGSGGYTAIRTPTPTTTEAPMTEYLGSFSNLGDAQAAVARTLQGKTISWQEEPINGELGGPVECWAGYMSVVTP